MELKLRFNDSKNIHLHDVHLFKDNIGYDITVTDEGYSEGELMCLMIQPTSVIDDPTHADESFIMIDMDKKTASYLMNFIKSFLKEDE